MGGGEVRQVDAAYLEKVLGVLPLTLATFGRDGIIKWANSSTADLTPILEEGGSIREALAEIVHREKIDRLLIRREITTMPGWPGGPDLHWLVWQEPLPGDESLLMAWEADWTDEMIERRTAFTMAASHELRTPLTALLGFAEILSLDEENLTPQQAEAVAMIEQTAKHLDRLVEDIFDLTRNSFGELRLDLGRVDLPQVVRSSIDVLTPDIENGGQSLTCEIDPGLPPVEADEARVRQMLSNLVGNASTHNAAGTRIAVSVARDGGEIAVTVADDGKGLPFRDPEQAFNSFNRGDPDDAGDIAGAGIGLTITKRLIELHRGRITAASVPGEGATFTLRFPIDRAGALAPGEPGPA